MSAPPPEYPAAFRGTACDLLHGTTVADPYRWLEDPDAPWTRTWLVRQAALFARARVGWRGVDRWYQSLRRLTSFDRRSVPHWRGGSAFYTRLSPGSEHPALMVEQAGRERTLFSLTAADPTGRTVLGSWAPSRDGQLLAYQVATDGSERFVLRILDVRSGEDTDRPIAGCRYSTVAWLPGQDAFYYSRGDGASGQRVYLHRVGEPADEDAEIFGDGLDETSELDAMVGDDGRWLVVQVASGLSATNELWLADLHADPPEKPALRRLEVAGDGWTSAWPAGDGRIYLLTDAGAPRGRLLAVDPAADEASVRTVVPEDPRAVLEGFAILDHPLLLVQWSVAGHGLITRHDITTGARLGQLALPGSGVVSELVPGAGGHEAWFEYSDRTTPETIYRYDARTDTYAPWHRRRPAAGRPRVVATEVTYAASDTTEVRVLLLQPGDAPAGPLPTILEGYGAFGEPQVAEYYAAALAWAEHGGRYAVACVRGGGEGGEDWHHAGRRQHKQRGIDDLISAAEHLIAAGYATPDSLGAYGRSAGGLLVGAAMVQRPDLFAAVACTAPLLDMARYELTGLGELWRDEFGTREDPEQLAWLLGYSPYHHVTPGTRYPAVLLSTFEEDSRVHPSHGWKMAAALQYATTSPAPVLLRNESGVGHNERSRSSRLAYFADLLAFFARHLGDPDPGSPTSGERR